MSESHAVAGLLTVLVTLIVAAKLLGWLARRAGLPAVLGEIVAGVLLGGSALGILDPGEPIIAALAQLGVVILLFEIGLHTEMASLARVGGAATTVAVVGVALPFALGYAVAAWLGLEPVAAIVCGAALTATSVAISARVLSDLGRVHTDEGRIVLGAALIDDVIGLMILSVVAGLAEAAGSAMIIGAFAAGVVLNRSTQKEPVRRAADRLGYFFVPIFFGVVGASVDIRTLGDAHVASIAGALTVVAVTTKFAAGYSPWWFRGNKALIGSAMIPRGEVGLIFAQVGLAAGAVSVATYSALTLTVMATTLIAPFAIRMATKQGYPPYFSSELLP